METLEREEQRLGAYNETRYVSTLDEFILVEQGRGCWMRNELVGVVDNSKGVERKREREKVTITSSEKRKLDNWAAINLRTIVKATEFLLSGCILRRVNRNRKGGWKIITVNKRAVEQDFANTEEVVQVFGN